MSGRAPVLLFFLDGVGLGGDDPAINPFVAADLPHLTALLGSGWFVANGRRQTDRATLVPTDANLGVPGRPQSATGQAALLTGRNVPRLIGDHYGPKPTLSIAKIIREGSLFHDVVAAGQEAALLTPYPPAYFAAIERGHRLLSAVPLAAQSAGIRLRTVSDLRAGAAVSPDFTNEGWHTHLGFDDLPLLTPEEAGERLARVSGKYAFSFFEHWPTDRSGHRGTLAAAAAHLEVLDRVLGGLLAAWPEEGLLIITSDHGNIEEKDHRQHTRNPVPTILVGAGHAALADEITALTDIPVVVRRFLGIPARERADAH